MKKKFLSLFMVIAITIFNFVPFVNVHAEGGIGQTGTSIVKTDELQKESTVYAGEIFVDGSSQMQWLYSSDISNLIPVFENLKTSLNGTTFADLVPTLDENTDNNGLAVSSSHQSDMNNSWTSANYVANQFYTGTIGTETNGNLYDNNTTYKNNIDTSYSSHQGEVDNPIDFSKRVLSTLSVASDSEIVSIEGVPTRVITITFNLEATTIIYTSVNVTTTSSSKTPITSAEVTLTAPKVGDKVEKITKNDGYGDYDAQSLNPTVTTTTEGISVYAYWVSGLEDLSEEPFYGTFEEDKYYYAMIDFEAEEGYELPATFPDGIKVNGVAPDEIFAVYGGTYTHCVVKIKATTTVETSTYEYVDNTANQTYTINKDDTLTVRINADYSLFENGGKVYVDGALVDSKNYTSKSGSTIITFAKDYMNSLSAGNHTLKVVFNNGGTAETTFTIANANTTSNPQTGDNVMFYISMLGLSIIGLAGVGIYTKKKRFN